MEHNELAQMGTAGVHQLAGVHTFEVGCQVVVLAEHGKALSQSQWPWARNAMSEEGPNDDSENKGDVCGIRDE